MSPLFSHRCQLPDRPLWFGWASLYKDRVCIGGWTWRGRYRRTIPLERVIEVERRPAGEGPNLILHLEGNRVVPLALGPDAVRWDAKLHDLLDQHRLNRASLAPLTPEQEGGVRSTTALPAHRN